VALLLRFETISDLQSLLGYRVYCRVLLWLIGYLTAISKLTCADLRSSCYGREIATIRGTPGYSYSVHSRSTPYCTRCSLLRVPEYAIWTRISRECVFCGGGQAVNLLQLPDQLTSSLAFASCVIFTMASHFGAFVSQPYVSSKCRIVIGCKSLRVFWISSGKIAMVHGRRSFGE
jgi:hypothetical protein